MAAKRLRRKFLPLAIATLAGFILASPCPALDGRLEFQNIHQEGGAGLTAYTTSTRRESGFFSLRVPFENRILAIARFRILRESLGSAIGGLLRDTKHRTYQPSFTLSYTTPVLSVGADGSGYRRDTESPAAPPLRYDRFQYGAWMRLQAHQRARVTARWMNSTALQEIAFGGRRENSDDLGTIEAEYALKRVGQFRYVYSRSASETEDRQVRLVQTSQIAQFNGSTRTAGDRIDASLLLRSRFFTQETETGSDSEEWVYLMPFAGGVLLDDTPEIHDPLEGDVTPVPELYDQDRIWPTEINIGDSAPPVREFGGDYRNIQYDFGDAEILSSAFLYVDRTLPYPELLQWRVFVTNDPEGRQWVELGPAEASIVYRERTTGLQGWEVALHGGLAARYFKMVNFKLGPTIPDLFVTEMEVYSREATEAVGTSLDARSHRLEGSIGIKPTAGVRLRYSTRLNQREYRDTRGDRFEQTHSFAADWRRRSWTLSGRYGMSKLSSPDRVNTDVDEYGASATWEPRRIFKTVLAWSQVRDQSLAADRLTNALSLTLRWQVAPAFLIDHRISRGWRSDYSLLLKSNSATVVTTVRMRPVANMVFEFERADRWVSEEAGTGFQRYNDTGILLMWSPLPLIDIHSRVRQQVRETTEYLIRHIVSWSPLKGGSMDLLFSGNHYQDTRVDSQQGGVRASVIWRPRPRMIIEGGPEYQRYYERLATNAVVSTNLRVTWSF